MPDSTIGKAFQVSVFGESHGPCVGIMIDGCPAGVPLSADDIQRDVDRRIPQEPGIVSERREPDQVEILSGTFDGFTTGAPIVVLVRNKEARPQDYEKLRAVARPGHGDYPHRIKYGGYNDHRGGGRASGRLTVALVIAGAIAKKLLAEFGIEILAHTVKIHNVHIERKLSREEIRTNVYTNSLRCADLDLVEKMRETILAAKEAGDSVGGVVECQAYGVPPGVGEPFFDNLDGDIAKMMFSIPAVRGVEFGAGFAATALRGSEDNDPYVIQDGKVVTLTNNAGGILGGLSNGMPIVLRVAFKPPSSITKEQLTVNLQQMTQQAVQVTGRHDPCVLPKAVPVVEAAVAIVLADHMIRTGKIPRVARKPKKDL